MREIILLVLLWAIAFVGGSLSIFAYYDAQQRGMDVKDSKQRMNIVVVATNLIGILLFVLFFVS